LVEGFLLWEQVSDQLESIEIAKPWTRFHDLKFSDRYPHPFLLHQLG
jgi:hypothetical protein